MVILGFLAYFLSMSLKNTVQQQRFKTATEKILLKAIDNSEVSHLAEIRFEKVAGNRTLVRAVMRGPLPPSALQVGEMEDMMPRPPDGSSLELRIRFLETNIISRHGQLYKDSQFDSRQ